MIIESNLQSTDAGSITLVLLADLQAGLKNSMDHLDEFCQERELKINVKKGCDIQLSKKIPDIYTIKLSWNHTLSKWFPQSCCHYSGKSN